MSNETAALSLPAHSFGADLDDSVNFSLPELNLSQVVKFSLAIPAAVGILSLLSTGSAEAGSAAGNFLQEGIPFNFPVELGNGAIAGFLEASINSTIDSVGGMAAIGGVIGTIRLMLQAPGIWNQLTSARQEGQAVNYSAALMRFGGLFYQNTVSEAKQWALLPLLVAGTYWFNEMASFAPAEISSMFRMTALFMAGATFLSTIEALDPFR